MPVFVVPIAAGLNFGVVKELFYCVLVLQIFNDGLWDYLQSSY
jgi:hypothetical protein